MNSKLDSAVCLILQSLHLLLILVLQGHHFLRDADVEGTGLRGEEAPTQPVEEGHAQLLLQAAEKNTEGGRCDVQFLCRFFDPAVPGDGQDIGLFPQFHSCPLNLIKTNLPLKMFNLTKLYHFARVNSTI